ncbi:ankyrin repeat-containing domain protein [Penicillium malachiteum]|uniref:ankyrin repeat-containing domain protein n=1 Tax=Penicillium malachiteum TaxID=1324776 RepID=UPI002547C395|nr:ankyrin repeat-containing domain protein [Penicillium malachiteum]KAJ5737061.1 ankyrin repeat-containing domain protein [Penicillium malachiteum]
MNLQQFSPDSLTLTQAKSSTKSSRLSKKQRDRCKRDIWTTVSVGGKELVIRDVCAKIAAHVKNFTDVVDIAVQYDPVHAALPWAGVRFLLQLTFSSFEAFGAIVEGLEKATRLIARCGILEALMARYDKGITDAKKNLEQELVNLYSSVLGFLCKARKHHDALRLKRAFNLVSQQSFQESIQEMEAAERKVWAMKGLMDSERVESLHDDISTMFVTLTSAANGVDNLKARLDDAFDDLDKPLVRIGDQVTDLHGAFKENQRSDLPQWISTIPVHQHYREALTTILPGSSEWLLKNPGFGSWRDLSSSETFWSYGICIQRDAGRRNWQAYEKREKEPGQIGEKPAPLTVEECVDVICEVGRTTPFTIVIDGLDECNSQQRKALLGSLKGIRQRCRDVVKTFVSSRQERDITVYFEKGETLEVTPQLNDGDLEQFVKSRVEDFIKKCYFIHNDSAQDLQKLEKDITEKLLKDS